MAGLGEGDLERIRAGESMGFSLLCCCCCQSCRMKKPVLERRTKCTAGVAVSVVVNLPERLVVCSENFFLLQLKEYLANLIARAPHKLCMLLAATSKRRYDRGALVDAKGYVDREVLPQYLHCEVRTPAGVRMQSEHRTCSPHSSRNRWSNNAKTNWRRSARRSVSRRSC